MFFCLKCEKFTVKPLSSFRGKLVCSNCKAKLEKEEAEKRKGKSKLRLQAKLVFNLKNIIQRRIVNEST